MRGQFNFFPSLRNPISGSAKKGEHRRRERTLNCTFLLLLKVDPFLSFAGKFVRPREREKLDSFLLRQTWAKSVFFLLFLPFRTLYRQFDRINESQTLLLFSTFWEKKFFFQFVKKIHMKDFCLGNIFPFLKFLWKNISGKIIVFSQFIKKYIWKTFVFVRFFPFSEIFVKKSAWRKKM